MSYQVLARKWRPRSFATLVGQEHVVRALTHALDQQRLHHAYLFTGTRGVGKTTLARILAKALNCETGVTSAPCGICSACAEIDAGRFVDLLEVDAATNTKVDEMRVLLENAVYAPTRGRFKVYVIDEVHMLSTSAFNAMLKTLEEPPEHIKFILATTDPQKIPVTVLSRCLQFNLKQMPQPAIAAHLEKICAEEGVEAEPAALRLVAHAAHGSMRDGLSLLDQAIAYSAGQVSEANVRAMLGTVDRSYLYAILECIARDDGVGALAIAAEMEARSLSFDSALQELAVLLHRIALVQVAPDALGDDAEERERLVALARDFDPETTQLDYQIAVHGRNELSLAPDEYSGFTMTLLRMLAFRPGADVVGSDGGAEGRAPKTAATQPNVRLVQSVKLPPATESAKAAGLRARKPTHALEDDSRLTAPQAARESARAVATGVPRSAQVLGNETPVATPRASAESARAGATRISRSAQALEDETPVAMPQSTPECTKAAPTRALYAGEVFDGDWPALVRSLALSGIARQLAERAELVSHAAGRFELRVPQASRHLAERAYVGKLKLALESRLGAPVRLVVTPGEIGGQTVAAQEDEAQRTRAHAAEAEVHADAFVRDVLATFDATIDSIKPI